MATIRQRKAMEILVERGGETSMGSVMQAAGYTAATAKTPEKVTGSKGWAELMEEYLADDAILKAHKELMENQASPKVRASAVDMAYKVKGRYAPVKTVNLNMEAEMPGLSEINEMAGKVGDEIEKKLLE